VKCEWSAIVNRQGDAIEEIGILIIAMSRRRRRSTWSKA